MSEQSPGQRAFDAMVRHLLRDSVRSPAAKGVAGRGPSSATVRRSPRRSVASNQELRRSTPSTAATPGQSAPTQAPKGAPSENTMSNIILNPVSLGDPGKAVLIFQPL